MISTLRTISKIKTVANAFKASPGIDIVISVVTTIIVVTLLLISYGEAVTWLQANYYMDGVYEAIFEAVIDLIMLALSFFVPVGTIIAAIYAIFRTIISLAGWEDDIKEFFHNLFGHPTAQQAQEAFEKAVEIVDEIVAHKRIQNRINKERVIFVPLYPDVEK